jgi:hypothetical protein
MTSASRRGDLCRAVRASLPSEAEAWVRVRPRDTARVHSVFMQFAKCRISSCLVRSITGGAGARLYQSLDSGGRPKLAATPVYSWMSGNRLHPTVIREMFYKLVSSAGRAVTTGAKPHDAHHLGCSLPAAKLLRWYRESIDLGVRSVHPSVLFDHVESASTVLCLTITSDLLQVAGQRSDCFATTLSPDSVP